MVRQFCQFSQFSLVCTFHRRSAWSPRLARFASFTHGQLGSYARLAWFASFIHGQLGMLGLHGVLIIVGYAMFTMESCSTQCHDRYSMCLSLEL